MAQGQSGAESYGVCPDEGAAWLAQVRRECRDLRRMALRQTSYPGVQTDGWSLLEETPVQTQDVPTR